MWEIKAQIYSAVSLVYDNRQLTISLGIFVKPMSAVPVSEGSYKKRLYGKIEQKHFKKTIVECGIISE
ncbi:hypothetical protein A3860_27905 [Niastella vici]|uniref:Uncharacterized protein n=1 Tax=Niastella vici TaxID=1703345 RepID=A0A1V9FW15_9BACT|nr:hypothetical protein A3860_27905 [Niastella vici]